MTVASAGRLGTNRKLHHGDSWRCFLLEKLKLLSVVHNYHLLTLLIIHSLRTLRCLQIFIHAFRHFPWPGRLGRWPWLFHRHHLVHGHNPHPCIFIYNPQKLLYFSGWSWSQFSIPVRSSLLHECPQNPFLFSITYFLYGWQNLHKQKHFLKTLSTFFVHIIFL